MYRVISTLLLFLLCASSAVAQPHWTDPYDVVWTTPSQDAAGSMPLGNGEVGINLWVQDNGDLHFYISRTDSFSELGRLVKVGAVQLSLSPNPFVSGAKFRQVLKLSDGVCEITAGDGNKNVTLRVFVDSDRPVIHILGQSASPVAVTAAIQSWRTQRRVISGEEQFSAYTLHDAPFELAESADIFAPNLADAVAWYHRNEQSVAFPSTIKLQSLESIQNTTHDPLLLRTFGGWIAGTGFKPQSDRSIQTTSPATSFALRVAVPCGQYSTAAQWIDQAKKIAADSNDSDEALRHTTAWWRQFWDRSWVITSVGIGRPIPANHFSLRIGHDSNNENKFPGTIDHAAVFSRALSPQEIASIAAAGEDAKDVSIKDGLLVQNDGNPRDIPSEKLDFTHGLTLEAWIKIDRTEPGRIFDKLTAGDQNGFLFDTHPGDTLRLIVGPTQLTAPPALFHAKEGWHDVAATFDTATSAACIYLDGKLIADHPGDAVSPIARGYNLQRYVQACQGRGNEPIKFNGGIFTVEPHAMGKPFDPDWRAWGDPYWYQNSRHMYHPMLAAGDFEMMQPFFKMFQDTRPLCEARSKLYFGAQGAFFPETMTFWGTYANSDFGWNRAGHSPYECISPWWRYAWNQGPELVDLMLDYWDYTQDPTFLKQQLVPMASSVLKYFDTRFKRDADGRIILNPTQVIETFWHGVINDMPSVAGLNDITTRLCQLPPSLVSGEDQAFFARMKAACPKIPIRNGMLAAAEKYDNNPSNDENPELYAVWPFRLYGLGKPNLEMARATYAHRVNHLDVGWGYDGNCAALLGLTDEAARILQIKCANSNPAYRWPATWGPNFDWLPDQNHGGNLLNTTNLMLLQPDGDKIRILPAWPKDWDVSFKLNAPHNTVVECVYRDGKFQTLKVTPQSRSNDIILPW